MFSDLILIILPVLLAGLVFILLMKVFPDKGKYPLDLGQKINGKRIFGKNKNIRGPIIMGVFTSFCGSLIYYLLTIEFSTTIIINYLVVGLGYSLGELPNSFIKRQLDIQPGERSKEKKLSNIFSLIDKLDSLVVIALLYIILFDFSIWTVLTAMILGAFIHHLTDNLMIYLGLKSKN